MLSPLEATRSHGPDAHARARMAVSVVLGIGAMRRRVGPEEPTRRRGPADRRVEACLAG
ncbi:hypothetical protein GCM10020220_054250 [Nonomuraea rubra]|uniref:hypothetical protein n=1 Tax=Nonomuraea rubra TaxID=46180 RepID=UPI0031F0ED57